MHMQRMTTLFYLYLLEGIPYGIQSRFLPLILRSSGLSLTSLGLSKLLYVPWLLKSFYAPLVDTFLTKRFWLIGSLFGLFLVTLALAFSHYIVLHLPSTSFVPSIWPLATCLLLYNFFAATQDIAVDGIALHILPADKLALGNAIQVVGYKTGAIFGGGLLISLVSWFSVTKLFFIISCVYFAGILLCLITPDLDCVDPGVTRLRPAERSECYQSVSGDQHVRLAQVDNHWTFLKSTIFHSSATQSVIFLLLIYKLGEQGAMNMLPLMLFDRGFSLALVGAWTGLLGQLCSISGSTIGYKLQDFKCSTLRILVKLMVIRAMLQVPLFLIAIESLWTLHPVLSFYLAVLCLNLILFVSGTITTVMFTLMMQCTRSESGTSTQGTHYAILSTAELLGKLIFGVTNGPLTDLMGYALANLLFCFLSMLPIFYVKTNNNRIQFLCKHSVT